MVRPVFLAAACLAAATCVTAAATPAFAETMLVSTRGLDLASSAGRASLDRRIAAAADRMCLTNGVRPLSERVESRRCMEDAVRSTRDQRAALVGWTAPVAD